MASLTHSRRALHQPFFPFPSSSSSSLPPAQPPTPSFPKYPFTTTTTTTTTTSNSPPFFPFYPSPPPPPSPSLPTFPANISSLSLPSSSSSSSSHHRRAAAFLLPLLLSLLALLSLSLLLLLILHFRRRRRHHDLSPENPRSDSLRLFPPNSTASDGRKLSAAPAPAPATGTDFLYLGTLVNSRGRSDEGSSTTPAAESPYRKLGSPELRPLPPLAPHVHQHSCTTAEGRGASSPDEFYSPKDSPERKENSAGPAPSPRWNLGAAVLEKCASRSSTASSPPSAAMPSPSLSSSPCLSSDKSTVSRPNGGGNAVQNIGFRPPPPPPPPRLPPPPRRTMTPSPPKRQPPPHPPPVILTPRSNAAHGVESVESSDCVEKSAEKPRPKLKPLHWDKVRASSNCATVWDQLRLSSFQLNEEMIETLFVCNPANKTAGEAAGRHITHSLNQESRVLDPKKSQNIAILLRALNVTKEEVCAALLQGNTDSLGNELLETLLKMAPSKVEELKLREYKDDSPFKLGPAENFLKAVLDIPFAFKRVDAMLYIANFDSEVNYLRESFETLSAACNELRSSRLFLKLLEAVLKTGNRMNVGTNRGDAQAFKLDTLLKLVDIKGTDGKTTLLHFVVQEIIKAEGSRLSVANPLTNMNRENTFRDDLDCKRLGLQVVSGIGAELSNVKKAAAMESEILGHNVCKLVGGIEKIRDAMLMNDAMGSRESGTQFRRAMRDFLTRAEEEIMKVEAQQKVAMSLVNEVTEYFHGNSAMKEAHPFRIFIVVRDFLSILDQVCKEIGKINERAVVSSTWRLPVPVNPMISPLFPEFHAFRPGSSDDESSSSSSSSSS